MRHSLYSKLLTGVALGAATGFASAAVAQSAPPVATQPADTAPAVAAPTEQTQPSRAVTGSADDASTGVRDIIVTAQRKSEKLQNVPIAVNVIGGAQLTQRGIALTNDLPALVPGLTFITTGGAGTVFLRGIGAAAGNPNDEASVATYVDGVYIASPYANFLNLANIDRVEVLKGPQGTLFGRNATGGVIQVITRDPKDTPEVDVAAGYANYNTVSGSFYGTTGLGHGFAIDVAAQGSDQQDGWGRNVVQNKDVYLTKDYSVRSKLKFEPSDMFKMVLAGDYEYLDSNTGAYRLERGVAGLDGGLPPNNRYDTRGNVLPFGDGGQPRVLSKQFGISLSTTGDMGFARLISITAFRKNTGYYDADPDTTPLPIVQAHLPIYQQNVSQEIQLQSKEGSKIDWTAGMYYYSNTAGYHNYTFEGIAFAGAGAPTNDCGVGVPCGEILSNAMQKTESISGFAQATVELVRGLKLTGGIRYTDEQQEAHVTVFGVGIPTVHQGYKKPTWRGSLDYAFTPDIHGYVSYNRGVKGGGFDLLSPGATGVPGFKPEKLDAYEAGIKSKLFDNMLRLNVSAFWYDYSNIQVQVIPGGGDSSTSGGIIETINAARARIRGVDADFEFVPVHNLSIAGGAAYIDGKYRDFQNAVDYPAGPALPFPSACDPTNLTQCIIPNASGNHTIRTPKFTANATVSYKIETSIGDFNPSVTASHNSGFFFDAGEFFKQSSYTLVNASLGWTSRNGRLGATAWVSNLTDKYYLNQGVPSSFGFLTSPAAPRTFGGTLKVKLGG